MQDSAVTRDERGHGETLVLGRSRSRHCGGLIHNTSCPTAPSHQGAAEAQPGELPTYAGCCAPQLHRDAMGKKAVPSRCILSFFAFFLSLLIPSMSLTAVKKQQDAN
ncbi:hypothetical protein NHX12_023166 [Muraenolepis orangiensis]|uniref:Transmembrane protein n=1 Tax=Muraenolepis orangiensis TaxID=630683 RepID=A0A9Q0IRT4_9TELE|nr:hypothetical protein NHX12_023166 [Muraenolepis orangiensis]